MLLHPTNLAEGYCRTLKLNIDDSNPTKYFICSKFPSCGEHDLSISLNKFNCQCGNPLNRSVMMKNFDNIFVKSCATFIIKDDLTVMPNSMDVTNLSLLQNLGIKSTSSVKEMMVNVTKEKRTHSIERSLFFFCDLERPLIEDFETFYCIDENEIQFPVKLVIRKSDSKLLYALGEHDFANILLSFHASSLGGVVREFGGSFDTLYKSISDLDENRYFVSKVAKDMLVYPKLARHYNDFSQNILSGDGSDGYRCYYRLRKHIEGIGHNQVFITDNFITGEENFKWLWPVCREKHTSDEGYVKGRPKLYGVTDDLTIAPFSPSTLINFINRFETPFEDLKEKGVTIGTKDVTNSCLSILRAALTSTSALTNGLAHFITEVKEEIRNEDN
ncbi:uncharacterized protein [Medicago truncatula]|uniref:uncharacterized protein n=1 Tax=Medicago truncatula TaxID=3880 RepID=UPI000D2F1811|nr:uncharacterized protein LOC25498603 [Medicago truncatula]